MGSGRSDKGIDFGHQAIDDLARALLVVVLEERDQSDLGELFTARVAGFNGAIGIKKRF